MFKGSVPDRLQYSVDANGTQAVTNAPTTVLFDTNLHYLPIKKRYMKNMECNQILNHLAENDFYNLQKLAEVSAAIAAGQLFHLRSGSGDDTENSALDLSYRKPNEFESRAVDDRTHALPKPRNYRIGGGGGGGGGSSSSGDDSRECDECGKRYSTSSNLARHKQTHRSLADKKARKCPYCNKIYVSMPAYSMHVRTHNQGCECTYCGKCFSRPWLLQGHIRTHTGEKPFKCPICGKAFADKSNLRAHIQTHSNTKPHVCSKCGKAFALKSYLYKHEESSCMRLLNATKTEFAPATDPIRHRQPSLLFCGIQPDIKPLTSDFNFGLDSKIETVSSPSGSTSSSLSSSPSSTVSSSSSSSSSATSTPNNPNRMEQTGHHNYPTIFI